jgi:hypothetical protein
MPIKFVLKRNSQSSPTTNNPVLAEFPFEANLFTIGSDPANNLVLEESAFEQAVIVHEGDQLMLINSAEGTKLNGEILRREAIQPLNLGDEISIGSYSIFIADSEQSFDSTEQASVFTTNEDEIIDVYATTHDVPVDVYATTKFNVNEIDAEIVEAKPKPFPEIQSQSQIQPQQIEMPLPTDEIQPQPPQETAPQRNFADILDTLRTEDDSFYFTVRTADQEVKRITLDQAETALGVIPGGEIAAGEVATVCAVARKDWSGILIESQKSGAVSVNGARISEPQRLRHDDEVVFTVSPKYSLVLHEPSSLVALESLLSTRNDPNSRFGLGGNNQVLATNEAVSEEIKKESFLERRYFKHFSFVELVSMIIGTLIGAVLIFLLLEFIFS